MKLVKHINSASAALQDSGLPVVTQEIVKLRASQGLPARPVRVTSGGPGGADWLGACARVRARAS
jgi:hypothetical protein